MKSLLEWVRGFIPARAARGVGRPGRHITRSFQAALQSRLVSGWATVGTTLNQDLKGQLGPLRARARDLVLNSSYGARAINLFRTNVVGSKGITLQMQIKEVSGGKVIYDDQANQKIEAAWEDWCRMQNCTVQGRYTFKDVCDLAVTHLVGDGEALLRHRFGTQFKHGYALQVLDPALLDETFNQQRGRGQAEVVNGVELDADDRPVAYHFRVRTELGTSAERVRIPAGEIIHMFVPQRVDQFRGYPHAAPVLMDMKMLDGYYEAEVTAARMGAAKAGFMKTPTGDEYTGDGETRGDDGVSVGRSFEVAPGVIEELPAGYEFQPFTPEHPTTAFDPFTKALIRAIASGLNLSYHSLANDLENVNYSSIRAGELENREAFKQLQTLLIDHMLVPVFENFLRAAIMKGTVALPLTKFDKFNQPVFSPRRWDWVDPLKDVEATEKALALGLTNHTEVLAERGKDLRDTWARLSQEKQLAAEMELPITTFKPGQAAAPAAGAGN